MTLRFLSKAFLDPSSLLICAALASAVVYFFIGRRLASKHNPRVRILGLVATLIFASMLGLNLIRVTRLDNATREYEERHDPYAVSITVLGTIQRMSTQEGLTFRASSGQRNVGCNSTQPADAQWTIPAGAIIMSKNANWENVDNIRNPRVNGPRQEGDRLVASGTIDGLERSWFGNCPGGGHGELVISGTYRVDTTHTDANQTLLLYNDSVVKGQKIFVTLPKDASHQPELCTIRVSKKGLSTTITFNLASGQNSKAVVGSIPTDTYIDNGTLMLSVP